MFRYNSWLEQASLNLTTYQSGYWSSVHVERLFGDEQIRFQSLQQTSP